MARQKRNGDWRAWNLGEKRRRITFPVQKLPVLLFPYYFYSVGRRYKKYRLLKPAKDEYPPKETLSPPVATDQMNVHEFKSSEFVSVRDWIKHSILGYSTRLYSRQKLENLIEYVAEKWRTLQGLALEAVSNDAQPWIFFYNVTNV